VWSLLELWPGYEKPICAHRARWHPGIGNISLEIDSEKTRMNTWADVANLYRLLHAWEVDIHMSASFENLANSWPPSADTRIHAQESKALEFIYTHRLRHGKGWWPFWTEVYPWRNDSHMTTWVAQGTRVSIHSSITPLVTVLNSADFEGDELVT
jgi:hypothetical protein